MSGQGMIGSLFEALVNAPQPLATAVSSPERLFLERFGLSVASGGRRSAKTSLAPLPFAVRLRGDGATAVLDNFVER
jgi:hypothetical protein